VSRRTLLIAAWIFAAVGLAVAIGYLLGGVGIAALFGIAVLVVLLLPRASGVRRAARIPNAHEHKPVAGSEPGTTVQGAGTPNAHEHKDLERP